MAASGRTGWVVAARHEPTDELVGYTRLALNPYRPWLGDQGDTAVLPAHRGNGIGRWLKATNALRLLDERPDVTAVDTWNADVNEPMLAINREMGFRLLVPWREWELPL
jgi:GNAT superfamily N-acetyltransferase